MIWHRSSLFEGCLNFMVFDTAADGNFPNRISGVIFPRICTRFVPANCFILRHETFTFLSLSYDPGILPPWRTSNDTFLFSRKVSAEKKKDGELESRQRNGSENLGYIPEELWNTEQSPSESKLVNHRLSNCFSIWAFWTTGQAIKIMRFFYIYWRTCAFPGHFWFLEENPAEILRKHPSSLQLNLDLVLWCCFFFNAFVHPIVFWGQMWEDWIFIQAAI